jgi:hypothetical protein
VTPDEETSKLKGAVEEARRRAGRARASAVRAKAAGLPRFKAGEEAMARGSDFAGDDQFEESVRAFNNATSLFIRASEDAETALANAAARGGGPGNTAPGTSSTPAGGTSAGSMASQPEPMDKPAEKPAGSSPPGGASASPVEPIPRPNRNDPPKVTPPPPPVRPTVQSALEAYERALSRRDENALRAVYPGVPREVIESWSKKDSGVRYSSTQIIQTRDEFESPTRVRFECTFFYNFITNAGSPKTLRESRLVIIEKRGDNWEVADSRRR